LIIWLNHTHNNKYLSLIDIFEKYKLAFNETYKLVIIIVTIPLSIAVCERICVCFMSEIIEKLNK